MGRIYLCYSSCEVLDLDITDIACDVVLVLILSYSLLRRKQWESTVLLWESEVVEHILNWNRQPWEVSAS